MRCKRTRTRTHTPTVNHGADKARAREEFPEFGFLDGADILQVGDDADDEQAAAAVKIQVRLSAK